MKLFDLVFKWKTMLFFFIAGVLGIVDRIIVQFGTILQTRIVLLQVKEESGYLALESIQSILQLVSTIVVSVAFFLIGMGIGRFVKDNNFWRKD